MAGLIPSIAILRIKFGDLGLINGEWTICGTLPDWNRADWPVPEFVRKDPLSMKAWIVTYSDENPWLVVKETPTDYDSKLLSNGSSGYFAAAIHLRKAIEEIERHAE